MHLGKKVRMERFFNRHTRRSIIVSMAHGLTAGAIAGLTDMRAVVDQAAGGGIDACPRAFVPGSGISRWWRWSHPFRGERRP
jgi:DhnA family fructose-bisphosphate aldolase class Ia